MSQTRRNPAAPPARTVREGADDLDGALAKRFPPGVLLRDVRFQANETRTLQHGLGARPRGVFPSLPRGEEILLKQLTSDETSVKIENASSGDGVVDLWVYQ